MVQRWDGDHRAHNPKVAGSNPAPATNEKARNPKGFRAFVVRVANAATIGCMIMSNRCQTPVPAWRDLLCGTWEWLIRVRENLYSQMGRTEDSIPGLRHR